MATLRQKKAVQKFVENRGKSISKAMREADYSEATAKNPSNLTKSKGFREVFSETFTDEVLKKAHDALLNAKQIVHVPFPYKLKDAEIKTIIESTPECIFLGTKRFMTNCTVFFFAPDTVARDKALDKAYKIRGNYAQLEGGGGKDQLAGMDIDELDQQIQQLEEVTGRAKQYRKVRQRTKPQR